MNFFLNLVLQVYLRYLKYFKMKLSILFSQEILHRRKLSLKSEFSNQVNFLNNEDYIQLSWND